MMIRKEARRIQLNSHSLVETLMTTRQAPNHALNLLKMPMPNET